MVWFLPVTRLMGEGKQMELGEEHKAGTIEVSLPRVPNLQQ